MANGNISRRAFMQAMAAFAAMGLPELPAATGGIVDKTVLPNVEYIPDGTKEVFRFGYNTQASFSIERDYPAIVGSHAPSRGLDASVLFEPVDNHLAETILHPGNLGTLRVFSGTGEIAEMPVKVISLGMEYLFEGHIECSVDFVGNGIPTWV